MMDSYEMKRMYKLYRNYAGAKWWGLIALVCLAIVSLLILIIVPSVAPKTHSQRVSAYMGDYNHYKGSHKAFTEAVADAGLHRGAVLSVKLGDGFAYVSSSVLTMETERGSPFYGTLRRKDMRTAGAKVAPLAYWETPSPHSQARFTALKAGSVRAILRFEATTSARDLAEIEVGDIDHVSLRPTKGCESIGPGPWVISRSSDVAESELYCVKVNWLAEKVIVEIDVEDRRAVFRGARVLRAADPLDSMNGVEDNNAVWDLDARLQFVVAPAGTPWARYSSWRDGFGFDPHVGAWCAVSSVLLVIFVIAIVIVDHRIRRNTKLDQTYEQERAERVKITAPLIDEHDSIDEY